MMKGRDRVREAAGALLVLERECDQQWGHMGTVTGLWFRGLGSNALPRGAQL